MEAASVAGCCGLRLYSTHPPARGGAGTSPLTSGRINRRDSGGLMSSVLFVPVHLDALSLGNDQTFVGPMADFTLLPYFDGARDVNHDIAHISEDIVSRPFENQTLYLKAGVHLHWSLPDALTRGEAQADGTEFPAVPNRWLVIRSRADAQGQRS